jgi:hypothetical protein
MRARERVKKSRLRGVWGKCVTGVEVG